MGGQKDRLRSVRAGTVGGNGARTWAGNSSPSPVMNCRRPGEEEQRLGLGRASRTAPGSRNGVCPTAAAHGAGRQGLRAGRSLGQLSGQPTFFSSWPFWGLEHAASGPQGTDPQACKRPLSLPPSSSCCLFILPLPSPSLCLPLSSFFLLSPPLPLFLSSFSLFFWQSVFQSLCVSHPH